MVAAAPGPGKPQTVIWWAPGGRGRASSSRLAERGIDLKAIAEIAGHASIRTTAMYVESNPKRLARILQEVTF